MVFIIPRQVAIGTALISLNYDLADSAGGDSITITGTGLGSASACTVGGSTATITGQTSTTLTFTMPAKSAGTYNVQVDSSNTLPIEAWAPTDDASITLLMDAKSSAYNSGTGIWTPRKTVDVGMTLTNFTAASGYTTNQPSDGAGGVSFDGTGVGGYAGLISSAGVALVDYFTASAGVCKGSMMAVCSSTTTLAMSAATYQALPYQSAAIIGAPAVGSPYLATFTSTTDSQRKYAGHVYTTLDNYGGSNTITTGSALSAVVSRWGVGSDTINLSVNGDVSGSNYSSANILAGQDDTATTGLPTARMSVGMIYSGTNSALQRFAGTISSLAISNDKVSDSFVTKFYKWSKARFGVA